MKRFSPSLCILILTVFMCAVTWQGPFVNEDYEKIQANREFLEEGPLWTKFFQGEAGFERFYYRPLNNIACGLLARVWGVDAAGPFRAMSALAFGFAIWAFYWFARKIGLSEKEGLVCAFFFALHPFNSWYYFQGSWLGNTLVVPAMVLTWVLYNRSLTSVRPYVLLWMIALAASAYLACSCKDNGALVILMLLPLTLWQKVGTPLRRWISLSLVILGVLLYFVQRTFIVMEKTKEVMTPERIVNAFTHAGSAILQYVFLFLSGTNFSYGRKLQAGWEWPLTLILAVASFILIWRVRRKSALLAILLWCAVISWIEILTTLLADIAMAPSRTTVLALFIILSTAIYLKELRASWIRPTKVIVLALLLSWYALQSAQQVWASLDQTRFYLYHTRQAYSGKMFSFFGRILYDRGNWEKAAVMIRKGLEIEDRSWVRNNLALALFKQGRYGEAIEQYRMALALDPNDALVHSNLGVAYEKTDDIRSALYHYGQAIELDRENQSVYVNMARVLAVQKGEDDQILGYRVAPDLFPLDPAVHYHVGVVLAEQGHVELGIRYLRQAVKYNPVFARAHNDLGLALVRRGKEGDFDEAVTHFREALRIDPRYAKAHNNLGLAMAHMGDMEEAIRCFAEAVRLSNRYVKAYNNLGIALAKEGRFEEAVHQFREALRIDPYFENARENLEVAEDQLGLP